MGLDMYAYRVKKEHVIDDFDFNSDQDPAEDLAYWRKFNALHGWMGNLYRAKGGTAQSFNCTPIRLTKEDIDDLESTINENGLVPCSGFFFGEQTIEDYELESAKKFIVDARQAIEDGFEVYYDSWW